MEDYDNNNNNDDNKKEGYFPSLLTPTDKMCPMTLFMDKHKAPSEVRRNITSGILSKKKSDQDEIMNKFRSEREKEGKLKTTTDYLDFIVTSIFILSFVMVIILIISSIIWWRMQMFL